MISLIRILLFDTYLINTFQTIDYTVAIRNTFKYIAKNVLDNIKLGLGSSVEYMLQHPV